MEYMKVEEMTEPGQYWWLPLCDVNNSNKPEYWNTISWHPKQNSRERSGFVYGPLEAPIINSTLLESNNKKLKIGACYRDKRCFICKHSDICNLDMQFAHRTT